MFITAIWLACWAIALYGLHFYIVGHGSYKDYIFNIVFALLCAIFGFLIMANALFGKMMGALMFAVMGWFISFIFSKLTGLIPLTKLKIAIRAVICIAFACLVFTTNYVDEPEENFSLPAGHSHRCYYCGEKASYLYGGDYLCAEHYYLSKGMDGDFDP